MWEPSRTERSAGGVVVRRLDQAWHALLIQDRNGHWGLPKGHIEHGETVREAALREVAEETGVRPDTVGPRIATIDWHFRSNGELIHKYCTFFLMVSRRGRPRPQESEGIADCRWVPLDDAPDVVRYANAIGVVVQARELVAELDW